MDLSENTLELHQNTIKATVTTSNEQLKVTVNGQTIEFPVKFSVSNLKHEFNIDGQSITTQLISLDCGYLKLQYEGTIVRTSK